MRFVDTNILLYAVSRNAGEARKTSMALALLECDDLATSVQVLQEFYAQVTRPRQKIQLTAAQGRDFIEAIKRFPIQENTVAVMDAALEAASRWQLSYWDAAIVEAARTIGCSTLLTEDLNNGQDFRGVKVVNPFR
jgi:predicted nucleic acid-binding protein